MATEPQPPRYHWERDIEGMWLRVDAEALPEWVKSKKSVRFAAAGGILCKRVAGQPVERYRLKQGEDPDDSPSAGDDRHARR